MNIREDINEGLRRPLTDKNSLTNVVADLMDKIVDSIPEGSVKYTAGQNITIEDGVISATDMDTKYTSGKYISIGDDRVVNSTITAGTNINIDSTGKVSATDTTYSDATTSASGLMSASDKSKLNGLSNYSLPTASASTLGGVKVGSNLVINDGVLSGDYGVADADNDGLLSADDWRRFDNHINYTLPIASTSTLGGVMVGNNLSIDASGKLSANFTLPADSTFTTITLTDSEGSVSINAAQLRQLLALLTPEA